MKVGKSLARGINGGIARGIGGSAWGSFKLGEDLKNAVSASYRFIKHKSELGDVFKDHSASNMVLNAVTMFEERLKSPLLLLSISQHAGINDSFAKVSGDLDIIYGDQAIFTDRNLASNGLAYLTFDEFGNTLDANGWHGMKQF